MWLEILEETAAWDNLVPEWEALLSAQPKTTPFQLPIWLRTWWQHFGSGSLLILAFRQNKALVGIMPLFRHEWDGKRQLTLLGTGLSDWTDPILTAAALPLLEQYLENDRSWDVIDWQDLSADSPLAALAGMERQEETPCSLVDLEGTFDDFWAARGKDLRRNVRRYGDRARLQAPVEFAVTTSADPQLIDALIRLHGARWQQRGEAGMIASNHAEAFLRDVAQQLSREKLLRILSLRFAGKVTAVNLGVLLRNDYFAYMTAFDPEQQGLGLGKILLYESFRYCFENQIRSWQFLRGQEEYKASWGARLVPKIRLYRAR